MPVHDWTKVPPGIFHDFHVGWIVALSRVLNNGGLPEDCCAMLEPAIHPPNSGLTTVDAPLRFYEGQGGVSVSEAPPRGRFLLLSAGESIPGA
jgi:hypothetical protein